MGIKLSRLLVASLLGSILCLAAGGTEPLRIGVVTDIHAHDTESPVEGKVMSNYAERVSAFVDAMNAWPADIVLQLGDLVNGAFVLGAAYGDPKRIASILAAAAALFTPLDCPIHHMLGNHDLYDLSKDEFLAGIGQAPSYRSFDHAGLHIVLLDAQYNDPGEEDYDHVFMRVKCRIPAHQLAWLRDDLAATALPTIVCVHQPLDSEFDATAGGPPVVNREEVRTILSDSGVVIAVFQGHDHENRHAEIDGIHYVTFAAMVDHTEPIPPTWGRVSVDLVARRIQIEGAGVQADWDLRF